MFMSCKRLSSGVIFILKCAEKQIRLRWKEIHMNGNLGEIKNQDFLAGAVLAAGDAGTIARPAMTRPEELKHCGEIYGSCAKMRALYQLLDKVAPTDAAVLIIGETGVGKELVANALHQKSNRSGQPFVAINCGAIPANLIEAELFGHERGSFTGAVRMHKGCFERATGGTIFLDEITEMTPEMQVKLLRVLETGTLRRVGGDEDIAVDVRVIAATNRQPAVAVEQGCLREDLMYRLSVFPLVVPPLRDREEDVLFLAEHFLGELNESEGTFKTLSDAAVEFLKAHAWPGNVRELKNAVHRAFIMAGNTLDLGVAGTGDAAAQVRVAPPDMPPSAGGVNVAVGTPLAVAERQLIVATLQCFEGNKKKTAETLGISLKTLYNRLTEYRAENRAENAGLELAR
jgi:DNA-binding NtrC family response regulator